MDAHVSPRGGKRIAVFWSDPSPEGYPLDKEYYRIAYRELAEEIRTLGGTLFAVRGMDSFLGGNRFSHGWEFTSEGLVERPGPLEVDIVYDKGNTFQPDSETLLLNDRRMDDVCTNKFKTAQLFERHSPATEIIRSAGDIPHALEHVRSERVVLKPIDGEEGRGVFVVDRSDVATRIPSYPYLVQEFLDLSGGVPGLVEGAHDLRITSINGEIILCFIRTPPPNSLLANVAQGGKKIEVPLDAIPDGALAIWREVDHEFSRYPRRVYSVDLGRRTDGIWKIIEINDKPGCTQRIEGPNSGRFIAALAAVLTS